MELTAQTIPNEIRRKVKDFWEFIRQSITKQNKNHFQAFLSLILSGWLERIELSISVPQTEVLPLNYSHHGARERT